jgi:hypothetical protein
MSTIRAVCYGVANGFSSAEYRSRYFLNSRASLNSFSQSLRLRADAHVKMAF